MYFLSGSAFYRNTKKRYLSNIAVVRACWSAIICKYKYSLCVFCVFSVCVFCLCFHAVFSLCVFSSLCFFLSSLCFQYVLSVCVFCPCFLSGFAFLSINFDIILLWSGLADQLLFADINSQLIWLQYKYKILTRYFGLSGSPASSLFFWHQRFGDFWRSRSCSFSGTVSRFFFPKCICKQEPERTSGQKVPSRELRYLTLGKGNASSRVSWEGIC